MKDTYLIQRLNPPSGWDSFQFVGGRNSFDKKICNFIESLFSFDYMGAAEFEGGAVQAIFKLIAERSKKDHLELFELEIDRDCIHTWRLWKRIHGRTKIWIVCHKTMRSEVVRRVLSVIYNEDDSNSNDLKRRFGFGESLAIEVGWNRKLIGGLEIDNGFLISSSKEMAQGFLQIFDQLQKENGDVVAVAG